MLDSSYYADINNYPALETGHIMSFELERRRNEIGSSSGCVTNHCKAKLILHALVFCSVPAVTREMLSHFFISFY